MKFERISAVHAVLLVLVAVSNVAAQAQSESAGEQTSFTDVQQETQDLLHAMKSFTAGQQDDAVKAASSTLDKFDERIDDIQTRVDEKWDEMDQATRAKARASLKSLRKRRVEVAEWYGSMKNSSADAWGHVKNGFSNAYQALSDAWQKSAREFAADEPSQ